MIIICKNTNSQYFKRHHPKPVALFWHCDGRNVIKSYDHLENVHHRNLGAYMDKTFFRDIIAKTPIT